MAMPVGLKPRRFMQMELLHLGKAPRGGAAQGGQAVGERDY